MPSKRIIVVIGFLSLVICGLFGCIIYSTLNLLYASTVQNPALIADADSFMRDLQTGNRESVNVILSAEIQNMISTTKFMDQFAVKKITDWHFDTPAVITDTLRGDMTVDGNHYKIAVKFRYSDPGFVIAGYDFGEFGRGGVPIS